MKDYSQGKEGKRGNVVRVIETGPIEKAVDGNIIPRDRQENQEGGKGIDVVAQYVQEFWHHEDE